MSETNNTPARTGPRLTDAVTKWAAEAGSGQAAGDLTEVRIDPNEKLLVPFTPSVQEAQVHFLDFPSMRGYALCNGQGCLLCRLNRKVECRDLLPVYDPTARAVAVLAVPANLRPQSLRAQLIPVLVRVAADERLLLAVRKLDNYRYSVEALPLCEGADDGAEQVCEFLRRLEAGEIDLAAVYPRMSNEHLAELPEIKSAVKYRGLTP